MDHALGVTMVVTLWSWGLAEAVLQVRGFLRRGSTSSTEHTTLLAMVVLMTGGGWLASLAGGWWPALSYSTHGTVLRTAVLAVGWAGIAVRLWAIVSLGRFFRGTVHVQEDHQVVRSGPYRWVRHPSYTGVILAVSAFTVMLGSTTSWLVWAGCTAVAFGYRIRVEERFLTQALGSAYTQYAAGTRRLIPGVW